MRVVVRSFSSIRTWGLGVALVCRATSWAGPPVEVVRIEGTQLSGSWLGASKSEVWLGEGVGKNAAGSGVGDAASVADSANGDEGSGGTQVGAGRTALPMDDLQSVAFRVGRADSSLRAEVAEVHLADGGKIWATIKEAAEEGIVADTSVGDGVTLPFASLAAIWFGGEGSETGRALFEECLAARVPGKDALVTRGEEGVTTIRGSIISLGPQGGRLLFNRKERPFSRDAVLGIVFAIGLKTERSWPMRVELTDGGAFAGQLLQADETVLNVRTSFGAEIPVVLSRVARLRFFSGRTVYLSDGSPSKSSSEGIVLEALAARRDRSVGNGPLSVKGQAFEKGLGVHAFSALSYELKEPFAMFAATIGIDDAVRPRGSVVFRVEGDGRVLFESGAVRGSDAPRSVSVDVSGVKTLGLVVETGEDLDLSDHADWCDARLIRPRGVE